MVTHGAGKNRRHRTGRKRAPGRDVSRRTKEHVSLNRSVDRRSEVNLSPSGRVVFGVVASVAAIAIAALTLDGRYADVNVLLAVVPRLIAVAFILVGASAVAVAIAFALGNVEVAERTKSHHD